MLIDLACTIKQAKEKFLKSQERYLRPKKCSILSAPKVNPELWDDLSGNAKRRELGITPFSTRGFFAPSDLFPLSASILPRHADVISDTDKRKKVASRKKFATGNPALQSLQKLFVKIFMHLLDWQISWFRPNLLVRKVCPLQMFILQLIMQ